MNLKATTLVCLLGLGAGSVFAQKDIVHDAEYLVIEHQNKDAWNTENKAVDKKLSELEKKHGRKPNIVYVLWDDQQYGAVGFPEIQKALGQVLVKASGMVVKAGEGFFLSQGEA